MSDKFLNTNGGILSLSNGTANIFASILGSQNLNPSMPVKTNSVKQLVSSKLDIADVNNLQTALNNSLSNPFKGTLIATDFETTDYFSVNDELSKIENITSSTQAPTITNITGLIKVDEIAVDKIYSPTQSIWIDLDSTDVNINATHLKFNANPVVSTPYNGVLEASSFIKTGSTANQVLLGDGSTTNINNVAGSNSVGLGYELVPRGARDNWLENTTNSGGASMKYFDNLNLLFSYDFSNKLTYSQNGGLTWVNAISGSVSFGSPAYNGTNLFLCIGGSLGTAVAYTSSNGTTWNAITPFNLTSLNMSNSQALTYFNGRFIQTVVATGFNVATSSDNGINWAGRALNNTVFGFHIGVDDVGIPILVSSGSNISYTYDGLNWTSIAGITINGRAIVYNSIRKEWIASTNNSATFYRSYDGKNWSAISTATTYSLQNALIWVGNDKNGIPVNQYYFPITDSSLGNTYSLVYSPTCETGTFRNIRMSGATDSSLGGGLHYGLVYMNLYDRFGLTVNYGTLFRYCNKTTQSGSNGVILANGFKTATGISTEFLKSNGTVDSNTYALNSALTTTNSTVATNTANISTNTTNIATNASSITALQTKTTNQTAISGTSTNFSNNVYFNPSFSTSQAIKIDFGTSINRFYSYQDVATSSLCQLDLNANSFYLNGGDVNIQVGHVINSPKFIVPSGLSTQFLKADGTVDVSTYLSTTGLYTPTGLGNIDIMLRDTPFIGIQYVNGSGINSTLSNSLWSALGSSSAVNSTYALTNNFTRQLCCANWTTTALADGAGCGYGSSITTGAQISRNYSFGLSAVLGISDSVYNANNCQNFFGLWNLSTQIPLTQATQLSTQFNFIGFGSNTTDSNICIYTGGSASTVKQVDLGSSFPANRPSGALSTDWFKFNLYWDTTKFYYKAVNTTTGVVVSGTFTPLVANIPATSINLFPQCLRIMGTPQSNGQARLQVQRFGVYY